MPKGRIERPSNDYKSIVLPLNYKGISGRNGEIRTHDPLIPNQVLYQAEPHPDMLS